MSNDLISQKTMTVKEISEIMNVSERTILRYTNKLFPNKIKNGKQTILNELEITAIKIEMNKNYSLDNDVEVKTDLEKELLIRQAMIFQNEKIENLKRILAEKENQIKLLIHDKKTYTTTEIAKELNLKSASELNQILKEKNIQYKINNTWVLSASYSNMGYESIKQEELDNGKIIYNRHWTGKGRDFLLSIFQGL